MRAVICTKAGLPEVLHLKDVNKPIPGDAEILVKVQTATVTRGDVVLRKIPRFILFPIGLLFGFKAMEIPGVEFAGDVEAVGKNVTLFKKGDQVFGTTTGLKFGGNAEYVCVPEKWKLGVVTKKSSTISYSDAAAIPVGGMTALHILNKGNIKRDQKVLVYGASGSVGTYAVQLAKYFGAEVTGVCSTNNAELLKSIGADEIIDYTKEDFTKKNVVYDVIFDAVGKISKFGCNSVLKKDGKFLSVKYPTSEKLEYLVLLGDLVKKGTIKPIIDRSYPLEQIVEAHKYVEKGHKRGNVVVIVNNDNKF
ncbi:MAG: NAD(P)-dependent alcohol dehydrogenase [bacterium]